MNPASRFAQVALLALAMVANAAFAQTYPDRPIKVVVPWPAGGIADVVGRIITTKLAERLGQPLVIENRTGANGIVGAMLAKSAPADGYNIFLVTSEIVSINPGIYPKLPYDVEADFAPITPVVKYFYTLTGRNGLIGDTTKEILGHVKAKPGGMTYGSWGIGSVGHLGMEMLLQAERLEMLHVPYTGGPAAYNALVAGHVDFVLMPAGIADPWRTSGRLKALAVPGEKRLAIMDSVPTLREQGYDLEIINHVGFIAPAKTPPHAIRKLHAEISAVIEMPEVRAALHAQAAEPFLISPEEYGRFLRSEQARWTAVARKANVKLEVK